MTIGVVATDGIVSGVEDDGGVAVSGTGVGTDDGSDVDLVLTGVSGTVTLDDVSVSSGVWTTTVSEANLTALGEGTISVVGVVDDSAGNVSASVTRSFVYDATAPTVALPVFTSDNANSSWAKAGDVVTARFDFDEEVAESALTMQYRIGSGGATDFTFATGSVIGSGECKEVDDAEDVYACKYTVGASDNGLFKAKVSALADVAGNSGSAQAFNTGGVILDTTAPSNSAGSLSGPSSAKTNKTVSFSGTTNDLAVGAGDYVVLTAGTEEVGQSDAFADDADGGVSWTVSFSAGKVGKGSNTLTAYYYDAAGNRTTDASPPTAVLSVKSSGGGVRSGGSGSGRKGTSHATTAPVWGDGEDIIIGQTEGSEATETTEVTETVEKKKKQKIVRVPIPKQITGSYRLGDSARAVYGAQVLLNQTADCQVAKSGPGSQGKETQYFGARTRDAIECYQASIGLAVTGVLTSALYNHLVADFVAKTGGGVGSSAGAGTAGTSASGTGKKKVQVPIAKQITKSYRIGDSDDAIYGAQVLLNHATNCKVATSGIGSPGQETEVFGSLTLAAIRCYQRSKGLAVTGVLTPALYDQLAADFVAKSRGAGTAGQSAGTQGQTAGTQGQTGQQGQQQTEENDGVINTLQERLVQLRKRLAELVSNQQERSEGDFASRVKSNTDVASRVKSNTDVASRVGGQQGQQITIIQTYTLGDKNAIIKRAKQILNTTNCKIAFTGIDSSGQETNELTRYTANSLRCYQRNNSLPITGNLTPATWDALVAEAGSGSGSGSGTASTAGAGTGTAGSGTAGTAGTASTGTAGGQQQGSGNSGSGSQQQGHGNGSNSNNNQINQFYNNTYHNPNIPKNLAAPTL